MNFVKTNWKNGDTTFGLFNNAKTFYDTMDMYGDIENQNIEVYSLGTLSGILFKKEYEEFDNQKIDKSDSSTYIANLIKQKESLYSLDDFQYKLYDVNYNIKGSLEMLQSIIDKGNKSFFDFTENINPFKIDNVLNLVLSKKDESLMFVEIKDTDEILISSVGSLFISLTAIKEKYGSLDNLSINIKNADNLVNFVQEFPKNDTFNKLSMEKKYSDVNIFDIIDKAPLLATIDNNEIDFKKPHLKNINKTLGYSLDNYKAEQYIFLEDNTKEAKDSFNKFKSKRYNLNMAYENTYRVIEGILDSNKLNYRDNLEDSFDYIDHKGLVQIRNLTQVLSNLNNEVDVAYKNEQRLIAFKNQEKEQEQTNDLER